MAKDDYAILVGINHYPGLGSPLEGAERDAELFREWLEDPNGGDVPAGRIKLIRSADFGPAADDVLDAKPGFDDVQKEFQRLIRQAISTDDQRLGRRLYLFFSGHGFSPDIDESALIMANAELTSILPHLPGKAAAKKIIEAGFFDEVVLFMDCCRDDYKIALQPINWRVISRHDRQSKSYFVFATKWGYKAKERINPETGQKEGIFTRALLKSLRGGFQEAGKLNAELLEKSIVANLERFASEENFSYVRPHFMTLTSADIVFKEGMASEAAVHIHAPRGAVVLVRHGMDFSILQRLSADAAAPDSPEGGGRALLSLRLGKGLYDIVLEGSDTFRLLRIINTEEVHHVSIG